MHVIIHVKWIILTLLKVEFFIDLGAIIILHWLRGECSDHFYICYDSCVIMFKAA